MVSAVPQPGVAVSGHAFASPAAREGGIISAHDLTKTYTFHRQAPGLRGAIRGAIRRQTESRLAVDALTFSVQPGEVVGLLGPNGAGKTTTLKMLTGLLDPSGGEVRVLGYRPFDRKTEYLRRISLVMGQKTMLWWDVPAMESFHLHKEMYGLSDTLFRESLDELAALLEVEDLLQVPVRKLSLGERMKMELLAALLHRPEVVFLDEPTIGLDVVAKDRVRAFLAGINRQRGTTIVVTSHDMDDIEALCSRVMIVNHGRMVYDGGLTDLVQRVQPRKRVRATFALPVAVGPGANHFAEGLVRVLDPDDSDTGGNVLALEVEREALSDLLATLPQLGPLVDLAVADAEVEEIIRDLFTGAAETSGPAFDGKGGVGMSLAEVLRLIRRLVTGGIAGSLAYPGDFVFFMLGTIIGPIISAFVWRTAIAAGADLPVDTHYITTYFVLLSLVTMLASAWLAMFMADTIRDGRLNVWLARPGSFLYEMAANNIAEKAVKLVVLTPMIAIFAWFVRDSITLDAAAWRWGALIVSTMMAALIFFWLDVAMGSLGFWLEDISGLEWGRSLLTGLITGQMIPLALFPAWMQGFLHVQPFRYTISFPLEIVVADLSTHDVLTGLCVQAGWMVFFTLGALWIWRRGLRSYAAVGA